jgi:hypothetical protein
MLISELISALRAVEEIYDSSHGKNTNPITKITEFLSKFPEGEVHETIKKFKTIQLLETPNELLHSLKSGHVSDQELEMILKRMSSLNKKELLSIQRKYSAKRGVSTKGHALEDIKAEFYRRQRAQGRITDASSGPLM